jgi:hypothetical protein
MRNLTYEMGLGVVLTSMECGKGFLGFDRYGAVERHREVISEDNRVRFVEIREIRKYL